MSTAARPMQTAVWCCVRFCSGCYSHSREAGPAWFWAARPDPRRFSVQTQVVGFGLPLTLTTAVHKNWTCVRQGLPLAGPVKPLLQKPRGSALRMAPGGLKAQHRR